MNIWAEKQVAWYEEHHADAGEGLGAPAQAMSTVEGFTVGSWSIVAFWNWVHSSIRDLLLSMNVVTSPKRKGKKIKQWLQENKMTQGKDRISLRELSLVGSWENLQFQVFDVWSFIYVSYWAVFGCISSLWRRLDMSGPVFRPSSATACALANLKSFDPHFVKRLFLSILFYECTYTCTYLY